METKEILAKKANEAARAAKVAKIMQDCYKLYVGESCEAKGDAMTLSTIRVRLTQMKSEGVCFTTSMNGNKIKITRLEDEVVR